MAALICLMKEAALLLPENSTLLDGSPIIPVIASVSLLLRDLVEEVLAA
jgi:hypothetical protein